MLNAARNDRKLAELKLKRTSNRLRSLALAEAKAAREAEVAHAVAQERRLQQEGKGWAKEQEATEAMAPPEVSAEQRELGIGAPQGSFARRGDSAAAGEASAARSTSPPPPKLTRVPIGIAAGGAAAYANMLARSMHDLRD